jgi:hypothetical protein
MRQLKLIYRDVVEAAGQLWLLFRSMVSGLIHWRRNLASSQTEAERLDRIRNPSKYLGK